MENHFEMDDDWGYHYFRKHKYSCSMCTVALLQGIGLTAKHISSIADLQRLSGACSYLDVLGVC